MVEKPSPNPVDEKPSALSENQAVQNPAASSETGEISDNPSTIPAELKPDTSTENVTTSKSDSPESPVGEISDVPPEILSETKPVLPENETDPAATTEEFSGTKPDISSESPTHSDGDLFVSPKTPSISVSPPENNIDPEIVNSSENPTDPKVSNPSENPTDPEISNPSENTPRVSSVPEVSESRSVISSIRNFFGCTRKQIMYMFLFYMLIGIIIAIGIYYENIGMIAIYVLFVVIGVGALPLLKCCYGMIQQVVADYRNGKNLPSNKSNPSQPEILQNTETTESVVEDSVEAAESPEEQSVDIKSSEKDEDAAQEGVVVGDLTQEKETVRQRHVVTENK